MVDLKETETQAVIKPEEDIISSTVPELRDKILLQLQEGKVNITIDLSNVETIDSLGLGALISCYKALLELGGNLSFTSVSDELIFMFKVLKLDKYFSITPRT